MPRKKESFSEMVMTEALGMVKPALAEVRRTMRRDPGKVLFAKFVEGYDILDVSTILSVKKVLGHKDSEEDPCKVCQFIARKEIELQDEVLT